jgi:hypothetical protein
MDIANLEEQMQTAMTGLLLRTKPDDSESAVLLGRLLADGLMRYWILSQRTKHEDPEDFALLIDSLEFWAKLHGFPNKREPERQNGPVNSAFALAAGC